MARITFHEDSKQFDKKNYVPKSKKYRSLFIASVIFNFLFIGALLWH